MSDSLQTVDKSYKKMPFFGTLIAFLLCELKI